MPEQTAAEADVVFGVDSAVDGDAVPESTTAGPESVTGGADSISPEAAAAKEEANIKSQPGVKGHPTGQTGATGKPNHHLDVSTGCCMD